MATTTGHLNDTSDFGKKDAADHFIWHPSGSVLSIDVHPDVMDGIARDILESLDSLPPHGAEVGGLLLGTVEPGSGLEQQAATILRIERYHRIPCSHASGPEFILDAADRVGLERAATSIIEASELDGSHLSAVGIYRSHLRPGMQLEDSDAELISRYFQEAFDIVLLIKPETSREMTGQFFVRDSESGDLITGMQAMGPAFPYRMNQSVDQGRKFSPPTLRSHRLVPDFVPEIVEPAHVRMPLADLPDPFVPKPEPEKRPRDWKKWWPLPASLLVAGAVLWLLLAPPGRRVSPPAPSSVPAAAKTETVRPLALKVTTTSGQSWRISWNADATALHDARSVQLFVAQGDEQNRISLAPEDLASGTYNYKTAGNDVTFRLEVTDSEGRFSAESYHFVREIVKEAAPAPASNPTAPRAIHKVAPSIPASIRPRIKSSTPIDVRVRVDARGRVVSATLTEKHRPGLESYLAERAVEAAKQWKFEPAHLDGKPVAGEQTLRFTFSK